MPLRVTNKVSLASAVAKAVNGIVSAIALPRGIERFAIIGTATKTSGALSALKVYTSIDIASVAAGVAAEIHDFGAIAATTSFLKFDVDLADPNALLLPYLILSQTVNTAGDYTHTFDLYFC